MVIKIRKYLKQKDILITLTFRGVAYSNSLDRLFLPEPDTKVADFIRQHLSEGEYEVDGKNFYVRKSDNTTFLIER